MKFLALTYITWFVTEESRYYFITKKTFYYCREFIGKISIKSAAEEEELKKRKGKARLPPAINQLISIRVLYLCFTLHPKSNTHNK